VVPITIIKEDLQSQIHLLFSISFVLIRIYYSSSGWDLAEWSDRLTANAEVATVPGSIPASTDTMESEGRQMKQSWIQYIWKKIALSLLFDDATSRKTTQEYRMACCHNTWNVPLRDEGNLCHGRHSVILGVHLDGSQLVPHILVSN